MFMTRPVLYYLIHLSDFYSIAIIFVAFLHREKSLLSLQSFLKLCSFFTMFSLRFDTDLITALTKEITCGFSSAYQCWYFLYPNILTLEQTFKHYRCFEQMSECLIMLSWLKWPLCSQAFFLSPNVTVSLDPFRQNLPTFAIACNKCCLRLCWPTLSWDLSSPV